MYDPTLTPILESSGLSVSSKRNLILNEVELSVLPNTVYGIIGPSGAGKSTLLKCLNRLIDLSPTLCVKGSVTFHGRSVYEKNTDVDALRARIGMLFQQPVVFPRSILENTIFGVRHLKRMSRNEKRETAERALTEVALWDEVKDRLQEPAFPLSVGQQQRLCLARTLAVGSEVILMDEPTSALDPKSTEAIEELILRLKERHTIILVTHNVAQARRVTDWLACVCVRNGTGSLMESAACDSLLSNPTCREVIDYLNFETDPNGNKFSSNALKPQTVITQ